MIGFGIVAVPPGPGGGKFALGGDFSQQDIRHGFSALLSRLGNLHHCLNMGGHIQQTGQFNGPAGIEQQNDGQTHTVQAAQLLPFLVAKVVIPFSSRRSFPSPEIRLRT